MLTLINLERAANGLAPLRLNFLLNAAAETHSRWMNDADVFSHTGAGGSSSRARMIEAGYVFSGTSNSGENIAWQSQRGAAGISDDVIDLHKGLMLSTGHRANILNPNYVEIGIGIEVGEFTLEGRNWLGVMITQNFARSSADNGGPEGPVVFPVTEGADVVDGTTNNDFIDGLGGHDRLNGLVGNDILHGGSGNDTLTGGVGNDTMLGGSGDDSYIIDVAGDRVFETTTTSSLVDAGGTDTVFSAVSFDLDASAGVRFVEQLTLTGTANINATGNALANILIGNSGNNVLNGGIGTTL